VITPYQEGKYPECWGCAERLSAHQLLCGHSPRGYHPFSVGTRFSGVGTASQPPIPIIPCSHTCLFWTGMH